MSAVGLELEVADRWLFDVLTADPDLAALITDPGDDGPRVFSEVAPASAAYPFVVFAHQASTDVAGVGPYRIGTEATYVVKAVGEGQSYAPLRPVAARIDALLQGAGGAVIDGEVWAAQRTAPVRYPEITPNGDQYRHLGGLYRLWATAL